MLGALEDQESGPENGVVQRPDKEARYDQLFDGRGARMGGGEERLPVNEVFH